MLLLANVLLGQQVTFTASLDAKKVVQGSYFDISFQILNGRETAFEPPPFKSFNKATGPSTSSSMSIVNGRTTQSKTYTYSVLANNIGKFTIGPAVTVVNGKTYRTKPQTIEVVKAANVGKDQAQAYVKIIASDTSAYVGQQIWLTYKLYTRVNVQQFNIVDESDYEGFYVEELQKRNRFTKEVVEGVEYYTRDLQKVALFPQQVGSYEIPNTNITLGISNNQSNSFFKRIDQRLNATAEGFIITVQDLPPNPPKSFSGAVGKYQMNASTNKRTMTTDDAIVFKMYIEGNGDSRMVDAPIWDVPEDIEWYDPNTISEEQLETKGSFKRNKEVYEYILVPKKKGRYQLRPKFTYFDVDSNKYITLNKGVTVFNVAQGSNQNKTVVEEDDSIEFAPIIKNTKLTKERITSFNQSMYFGGLGFLACLALGLFGYRRKLENEGYFDQQVQRKKKAKLRIVREMEAEIAQLKEGSNKQFVEILSIKLRKYVTQKFRSKDVQLTDQEILDLFQKESLPASIIEETKDFFKQSELIIYAASSIESKEALKLNWEKIINQIEDYTNPSK